MNHTSDDYNDMPTFRHQIRGTCAYHALTVSRNADGCAYNYRRPTIVMNLLTVVVPAYNVQAYVARCIESILCQPDATSLIDLIVVVDGATDDTLSVVQSIVRRFVGCMRVVVQDNHGLSAARNVGVGLTSTEYVTFLDGDDIWLPDYLSSV